MTDERWRKELFPECCEYVLHDIQDASAATEQVEESIIKNKHQEVN